MAGDSGQPPALMLDTNVLTFLTDPRNPKPEWDEVIRGRTLVLSFVTVGEILLTRTLVAGSVSSHQRDEPCWHPRWTGQRR